VRPPGRRCPPITAHRRCSTGPSTAAAGLVATTAGDLADIETATRAGGRRSRGCGGCAPRWAGRRGGGCPCPAPTPSSAAVQIAVSDPRAADIALLAALAAWRQGRGIYRCARARGGPGGHRPDGALPVDVLYRLPEWCVYKSGMGTDAHAHLEWDVTHARPELRALHAEDGGPSVARPPRPPDTGRGHRVDAGPRPRPTLLGRAPASPTMAWPSSWPLPGLSWPPWSTCARPRPTWSTSTAPGRRHDGPWPR